MAYYWCSLTFDKVGTLLERNSIVYGETEQEFIRNMSRYLRGHYGTHLTANDYDMRLKRMEAEQNMSGADLGLYSPAYPDSDDDDAVYFVRKKQLCSFERENLRVLDLRNYHEAILAHAVCFAEERLRYCRKKKQGKRHKKGWNYHWHKGIRNKLILDSKGMLRAKVAELFDKNVWQQYMKIMEIPYGDDRKQALEKWDTDMDRILQASEMPSGVKDFLFQSDCAGNISRSACMALYERIHNYDNNIAYGFRIVKDSFGNLIRQELGFQDFVELIKECIDTNCDLLWS